MILLLKIAAKVAQTMSFGHIQWKNHECDARIFSFPCVDLTKRDLR